MAVFEYEPGEDDQFHEGLTISYLKVVCTLTGYQEKAEEIGVRRSGIRSYWKNQPGIEDYINQLEKYHACLGAVLEVTVGPEGTGTPTSDFPYFMDFEPKKRELYQMASDTNERQSRSVESLNLTKSAGTTQSLETYDIDMGGGGFGANASVAGTGGGFTYSAPNGQWGTKRLNADESMTARSSDVGQEKRETYSFSTQISQLYHQLDSYHLGTNRAVFFVLPRPHTAETERTFVNGIRNIEGIQEFFLVVARPRSVESFCVEAYLETGHIGKVPRTETEEIPGTELTVSWPGSYQARPKGDDDETTVYDDADRDWAVETYYPGMGYKIKSAVLSSPGAKITFNYSQPNLVDVPPHIEQQTADFVKVRGRVHSGFANRADEDRWEEVTYPFTVTIALVKTRVVQKTTDTLFLTANHLLCCPTRNRLLRDGIVYERALTHAGLLTRGRTRLDEAHSLHTALQEGLRASRSDPNHRYERPVTLVQTDFAASLLAAHVPAIRRSSIGRLTGLSQELRDKLSVLRPDVTVADVLQMPVRMQQDVLSLTFAEVMELRGALTGASHVAAHPRDVWLSSRDSTRLLRTPREPEGTATGAEESGEPETPTDVTGR